VAAFDADPDRERDKPLAVPVYPMERIGRVVREKAVRMAIIAVPANAAQEVANELVEAGIGGILNFSPALLTVPDTVTVNSVNLAIELENLSYFIQQ
jgi:redox-sensing transcriptional repressor